MRFFRLGLSAAIFFYLSFAVANTAVEEALKQREELRALAAQDTPEGLKAKFDLGLALITKLKSFETSLGGKTEIPPNGLQYDDLEALKWLELVEKNIADNPSSPTDKKVLSQNITDIKKRIADTAFSKELVEQCQIDKCPSSHKKSYKTQRWNWTVGLANRYLYGYGTSFNSPDAIKLLESAATEGELMSAAYLLAKIYGLGLGVPISIEDSKKWTDLAVKHYERETPEYPYYPIRELQGQIGGPWWKKSVPEVLNGLHQEWALRAGAEPSDPAVFFERANAHFRAHDGETGVFWLKKATDANHAPAKFLMYQLYKKKLPPFHKRTIAENTADAVIWRKISADSGNAEATFDMFYEIKSDPKQAKQAVEFLKKASELGSPSADLAIGQAMLGEGLRLEYAKLILPNKEEGLRLIRGVRQKGGPGEQATAEDLLLKITDPKLYAQKEAKKDQDMRESLARTAKYYDPAIQNRVEKIARTGPANQEELDFLCDNLKPELKHKKDNACESGKRSIAYKKSEEEYKARRLREDNLIAPTDFKPSHSDAAKASYNSSVRQSSEANARQQLRSQEAARKSQQRQQNQRDRNIRRSN